jgi:molybdenum cofactor cytidylyltransferase
VIPHSACRTPHSAHRGSVVGVVLAAGSSSRLGRTKQLLPLGGRPLLARTLDNAARSSLDAIVVVLGHDAQAIQSQVDFPAANARVVVNERYREGQSTSLHAGLAALPPDAAAALFILGDQPLLGPAVFDAILDAYARTGGPIVQPVYGGRRGNPVLFDRALWPELAQVTGDQGARGVLRAHQAEVVEVPIEGEYYTDDIDTEEDYQRLLARYARESAAE